ncbi:glycine oxidase ThiO [Brevibacillus fulvus]|uniref:glycine oxidase n=1 Tax=Brevibacillus fulvus TaxID=1125967 RepID=A0A938XXM4_9BACL|nr:glycine oxidase ThiO [Brevibacillus fulvus]MBM7589751.1 glycine oxidase [Brevibacillus fulvus]
MADCLIIGGGIIGLSLAYELSRRQMAVTLIEQGEWGGQASSAAAGMLAPLKEFSQPGPLLDLGIASLAAYPEWVATLEQTTGGRVQLALDGLLTVALTEAEREALQAKYQWQRAAGYDLSWLEGEQLREVEPFVSADALAAIYSPGEGHINNQLLLQTLLAACLQQGVILKQGVAVTGLIQPRRGQIAGVVTTEGEMLADHTVIAAGAWSGLLVTQLGLSLPVRPVRGQVAAVSASGFPLKKVIFGANGYLAPKKDGRIVIGATEDEAGYRKEVTLEGLAKISNGVLAYVPQLRQAAFLQAWAGLRPATADGLPILGPLTGWEGISFATGHFRNGILLSPITARLLADWLLTGQRAPLAPFSPDRFAAIRA